MNDEKVKKYILFYPHNDIRYMQEKRCIGHCCEHFHLKLPSYAKNADAKDFLSARIKDMDRVLRENTNEKMEAVKEKLEEYKTILDMIIPIKEKIDLKKVFKKRYIDRMKNFLNRGKPPLFKCKHFDSKVKKCNIYDKRPIMCREFPLNFIKDFGMCVYKGCTLKLKYKSMLNCSSKLPKEKLMKLNKMISKTSHLKKQKSILYRKGKLYYGR